jgi:hypothetical protein
MQHNGVKIKRFFEIMSHLLQTYGFIYFITVEEGVALTVIEAMKIEIPIIAPERMRVDAITIEKG